MSKKYTTNFLEDTNGSTGSANQVLVSTASGVDWVDGSGSGIIGGPYLPLTAGSTVPLSGDLYINNATYIRNTDSNGAVPRTFGFNSSNNMYIGPIDSYAGGAVFYGVSANVASHTLYTGGSARMIINSSGNVGIGTTSPTVKLDINVDDNGTTDLDVLKLKRTWSAGTATDRSHGILFSDLNSSMATIYADRTNSAANYNSDLLFATNTGTSGTSISTKMTIKSDGNVGIGTTSPGAKLEVSNGSSGFTGSYNGRTASVFEGSNSAGTTISIMSPDTGYSGIFFGNNTLETYGQLAFDHVTNSFKFINGGGSERMRINSAGNVVINSTTTPYVDDKLYIAAGNAIIDNNKAYLQYTNAGARATVLALNSSNNLFVGQNNANNANLFLYGGTGNVIVSAGAIEVARFTTSGNVGIGTTAPGEKLEVVGNIRTNVGNGLGFMLTGSSASGLVRNAGTGLALRTNSIDKLIIDSTGSVTFSAYTGTNEQGTPTYLLGTDASGNVVKTLASGGGAAPQTSFSRGGINSSTYTMLFTAMGGGYGSLINMTVSGTSGNVVVSASFEIIVNHSQDIHVRSMSGDYTLLTLRITSDNNATYSVEAKHNGSTTTTVAVCVQPQNNDTITPTTTDPGYTGAEYIHTATEGWRFGGEDNNVESSNVIVDGNVGIGTTTPGAKLDVNGATYVRSVIYGYAGGGNQYGGLSWNGTDEGFLFLKDSNVTKVNINSNGDSYFNGGNVGIGVTGPVEKLDTPNIAIGGSTITGYTANKLRIDNNGGTSRFYSTGANTTTKGAYVFHITSSDGSLNPEIIRIASDGNVGIGETNPDRKLHVNSGSDNANTIFESTDTAVTIRLKDLTGSAEIESRNDFRFSNNAGVDQRMVISTTGAIKFNNYNSTNNTGTPTYLLGTDGSGNVVKVLGADIPGVPAGSGTVNTIPLWTPDGDTLGNSLITTSGNDIRIPQYVVHSFDTNTFFGFPTTDTITFSTDASERMRITSNGNVGIGTTSPGAKLHVSGGMMELDDGYGLRWGDNSVGIYGNAANETISMYTSASERIRIDSNGNVGIGITGPAKKLTVATDTVNDGVYITTSGGTNVARIGTSSTAASGALALLAGGSTKVFISAKANENSYFNGGGNVGIGTTAPIVKLDVVGTARFADVSPRIVLQETGTAKDFSLKINTDGRLSFLNDDLTSEVLTIKQDGNVGIGTITPAAELHIMSGSASYPGDPNNHLVVESSSHSYIGLGGGVGSDVGIHFGDSGASGVGRIAYKNSNNSMCFRTAGGGDHLVINSSGNVGIGTTSPGSKLQVAGEIRVADGTKAAPSYSFTSDTNTGMYSDAADTIKLVVGGDDTLIINSSSNVGIGTSAPDVKFHVTTSEDGSGIDKGTAKFINTNTGQGATTMHIVQTSSSAYANAVKFWQGSTPTPVGFIRLTTSATQFITSASDLNLKKNITNWNDDTLSKFKALEPKKFRFKTQDVSEDKTLGFIAQNEVSNFPEAYPQFLGEDEQPYYGFNPSGMVPHLMKAIKDLVNKVETLENRITQLENNN